MALLSILLAILAVCLGLLYWYYTYMTARYDVFKKIGVVGPAPLPIFGNFLQETKVGLFQGIIDNYNKYKKHKAYGIFRTKHPILMVADLDMIREICVKRFNTFVNRMVFPAEEPFNHSMTMLKDDHWKNVRTTVSPAFSTSKLKRMFQHVERTSKILIENLREKQAQREPVELKDTLSHFTLDVIASTGFGHNLNSLKNPDDPFLKAGNAVMNATNRFLMLFFFLDFLVPLIQKLGSGLLPRAPLDYFKAFLDKALDSRRSDPGSNSKSNDFLQLMVEEAENESTEENDNMTSEEAEALQVRTAKKGLSYLDMQGQALIFILAGFDTTASVMSFTTFLLAMNPDCCKKVQEEIDDVLQGEFPTYENVQKLPYLDMCINEAIRLYPPGFQLDRVCNEDCEIQGIKIPKDMVVAFPVCGIHRDPELFPEPEKFIPERFTPENKAGRHPYAHMPFGYGPRNCIGMRLALMEIKVGIAAMLQVLTPVACAKSVYPIQLEAFRIQAKDGLWVNLEARD